MYKNTTGFGNTAGGYNALYNNNGSYNKADGYQALYTNTTGSDNTAIGAFADVTSGALTNATAIGYNAKVDASNKVRIGNTSVTSIGGQVGWTIYSNGRYKKDIKDDVQGLAFINSLRPITYTINVKGLNDFYNKRKQQMINAATPSDDALVSNSTEATDPEAAKATDVASRIVYTGFVARKSKQQQKN